MSHVFDWTKASRTNAPFPHFFADNFLQQPHLEDLLSWFEESTPWQYKSVEEFYSISDIGLGQCAVPAAIEVFRSPETKTSLLAGMEEIFQLPFEPQVDVQAQRMCPGQVIKVHTDFGAKRQTHRIVVQVNRGWAVNHGGLLLLLNDPHRSELSIEDRYYLPKSGVAVGFEISSRSYHAVSMVEKGVRFTLTYSFYCEGGYRRLGEDVPVFLL